MLLMRLLLLFGALLASATLSYAQAISSEELEKFLKSENRVIVYGERYIDYGEFAKSNYLLAQAIIRYPNHDVILSLYGKSLYESGQKDQAENYFMQALRLNASNIIAQQYIEQIRDVRSLSVSEESQEWSSIIKDKIGDLIVFVLSIWLGTSFNSIWRFFFMKWQWYQAKKSYLKEDYDDVVRVLESQAMNLEQDAIDKNLRFMLASGQNKQEVGNILKDFVVREDSLTVLLRSLDLLDKRLER